MTIVPHNIIMTVGAPGSGKTTWAQAWASDMNDVRIMLESWAPPKFLAQHRRRIVVSRDDVRRDLGLPPLGNPDQESQVTAEWYARIREHLGFGHDVCAADTNRSREAWQWARRLAAEVGAEVLVHDLRGVPLETCLRQNAQRPADQVVPESAVRRIHEAFARGGGQPGVHAVRPAFELLKAWSAATVGLDLLMGMLCDGPPDPTPLQRESAIDLIDRLNVVSRTYQNRIRRII